MLRLLVIVPIDEKHSNNAIEPKYTTNINTGYSNPIFNFMPLMPFNGTVWIRKSEHVYCRLSEINRCCGPILILVQDHFYWQSDLILFIGYFQFHANSSHVSFLNPSLFLFISFSFALPRIWNVAVHIHFLSISFSLCVSQQSMSLNERIFNCVRWNWHMQNS